MRYILIVALGVLAGGCVLAPKGSHQTKSALADAGAPYTTSRATREIPDLPINPTWQDALSRALLASGELEAAYFEWAMAVSNIDQTGSYPSQPLELGVSYMLGGERMKAWDRTSLNAGLMDATAWPSKTYQSASVAWRDAQAAGERFRATKFKLQRDLLIGLTDYALQAERVRIQQENVDLLRLVSDTAGGRVRAGGPQQDLLRAVLQHRLAQDQLATMQSLLTQDRARLNAILVRPADAPLGVSKLTSRTVRPSDATLLELGVDNNPALAAIAHQITGREDMLERAKMEYLPDFNLSAGLTGSVAQFLGASVVLPTQRPKIRATIDESQADLRRVQAMRDQEYANTAAAYVAQMAALRDAERQIGFFEKSVLPLAEQGIALSRQSYAAGSSGYLDLIDAQRTLLDVRLTLAEARALREKSLAQIEMLAGADLETTSSPTTQETP